MRARIAEIDELKTVMSDMVARSQLAAAKAQTNAAKEEAAEYRTQVEDLKSQTKQLEGLFG
jgi:predicted  nucleic acid-binding Zn-ribbon protein